MKKIWLGIGAAVIVVLLLLQTRFTEYMVLWDSGYAMPGNEVKQMLMADIDELPDKMEVEYLPYEVLDRIFSRGLLYYLGEQKKSQINLSYPLYINDCAGICFVKDVGTLFDVDFEQAAVYQGLRVTDQIAYNLGGDRADATEYLFAGISDGLFINLAPVEYMDRGEVRVIDTNSVIYFTEEYFTYCEPNEGVGKYQLCRNVESGSVMKVGGVDYSYHDLLIKLQVIYEKKAKPERVKPHKDKEEEEEEYPEQEVLEATEIADAGVVSNITADASTETAASEPAKRASVSRPKKPSEPRPAPPKEETGGGKRPPQQRPPGTGTATETSRGVRPDEMRPDKAPSTGGGDEVISDPVAIGYVKPEVKILDARYGVYRLMLDVKVDDPARRLHPQRKIQFEFYEQQGDGKETLAYRTFTGGTGTVTAGNGSIKPGTTYRVNVYFTYFDEYDNIVVETVYEGTLTTNPFESLGSIDLADIDIDTYYDNCVVMPNVHYQDTTDTEAVYGLNNLGGLKLIIKGTKGAGSDYEGESPVDANALRIFKNGNKATFSSVRDLLANSDYTYEIQAEDFFKNKLTITNNKGTFSTCKARPQGRIELSKNVIGDIRLHVNMQDPDLTAIKDETNEYAIYLVLAKEKFPTTDTPEMIKQKATNDDDNDGVRKKDVYRFTPADYSGVKEDGSFDLKIDMDVIMDTLLLNQKYFAYLYCDFDLQNKKGPQRFAEVAQFSFTSASLNSLGRIYIKTDISNVNCDSAVITYTLDTGRTNDTLEKLLSDVTFEIVRGAGEEEVTETGFTFDRKAMLMFTGYLNGNNHPTKQELDDAGFTDMNVSGGDIVMNVDGLTKVLPGDVMMDASYFAEGKSFMKETEKGKPTSAVAVGTNALRSKTDYTIKPTIYATYDGVPYPMDVTLTLDNFKTWKRPAYYEIEKPLLAAEHLIFDVRVVDPDEGMGTPVEGAIIGNTGHKVIMNVYQTNGKFVTAQRIEKNKDFVKIDIPDVDIDKDYFIYFIVEEYNEGYTNGSYRSNYQIGDYYYIRDAVKISGDIKLKQLVAVSGDKNRLLAEVRVDMKDDDQLLSNPKTPFYITVAKDGADVTAASVTANANYDTADPKKWQAVAGDYKTLQAITKNTEDDNTKYNRLHYDKDYYTDKGKHKYLMTLYTIINDQVLTMDTLEFTTEDVIEPIDDEYDFVWKPHCYPNKRYVVTRDLSLMASKKYNLKSDYRDQLIAWGYSGATSMKVTDTITPVSVTGNFNGQIDFQGYELNYNADNRRPWIFTNIGARGEIFNVVFNFGYDNSAGTGAAVISQWYDTGILSHRNYGHIHDFELNYTGGTYLNNQHFGLLCRYNTISGIIENFAVGNFPDAEEDEKGLMAFTTNYMCGMIAGENWGTVRNGYLFGEDIESDTQEWSRAGTIYIGGITGYNHYQGRVRNVYSLINVSVASQKRNQNTASTATNSRYASLVGWDEGRTENSFSIGENYYSDDPTGANTGVGPAVANNSSRTSRVYYWFPGSRDYSKGFTYQRKISLATLYDYGWHTQLLGSQFKTSNVEVGYYPHVRLSSELPSQEYIKLPERSKNTTLDLMSTNLLYYEKEDGTKETESDPKLQKFARIQFRFYNPKNADITGINIEFLDCKLDKSTMQMEDGYTTLEAVVSVKPDGQYLSSYNIISADYIANGKPTPQKFTPMPLLLVDFYRPVNDENEWIKYVVGKPKENARLQNNLDFTNYKKNEMRVYNVAYQGKLDGNDKTIRNIEITGSGHAYLFQKLDTMAVVENLYVENVSIRGANIGETMPSLIQSHYGQISNVHVNHIKLRGYTYIGGMVAYSYAGSVIQDSSVSDAVIEYAEPNRCTSDGFIGGLVGRTDQANIQNCYVRKLDLTAMDMNACEGAGGLIGYSSSTYIDGAYTTGLMSVRGSKIGGIAGYLYFTAETSAVNNVLAKVDITGYQNYVGAMVGYFNFYTGLSATNNIGGVAYGNVFVNNPQAKGVSYVLGSNTGTKPIFYGSEVQSFNGILVEKGVYPKLSNGTQADLILTQDQVKDPASYAGGVASNLNLNHYRYDELGDGFMPKLTYYDGHALLPGQDDRDDDRNLFNGIGECPIYIKNVALDTNNRRVMVSYTSAENNKYIVTDIKVGDEKRKNDLVLEGTPNIDLGTIFVQYALEQTQHHWLDSYWISEITYAEADAYRRPILSTQKTAQLVKNPVRIPLTMYRNISSATVWDTVMKENGNNYENFRVTKDIGFASGCNQVDTRLGRLIGSDDRGQATSIVGLKLKSNNLIYRLNSEMGNLNFKNSEVECKGITYAGFVGSVYGEVYGMSFEDITVNEGNSVYNVGMIGQVVSGYVGVPDESVKRDKAKSMITLKNVTVTRSSNNATLRRVGGLIGYTRSASKVQNITGDNINVRGYESVGGILGYVNYSQISDISVSNVKVNGIGGAYVGGIVGLSEVGWSYNASNFKVTGTPDLDEDGWVTASTTVISSTSGTYVGGIGGYIQGSQSNYTVEGIVVRGTNTRIGGAVGYAYGLSSCTVKDVLIENSQADTSREYDDVGGVLGLCAGEMSSCTATNVCIKVQNARHVGAVLGYRNSGGGLSNCVAKDCAVLVKRKTANIWDVGGLTGRADNHVEKCAVINCNVIAPGYGNVGGLVGYMNHQIDRCYYYAKPNSNKDPSALYDSIQYKYADLLSGDNAEKAVMARDSFVVLGRAHVGGIVGVQNTNQTAICYSNANVIAQQYSGSGGENAGGVVGYYNNTYTINAKKAHVNSTSSINRNYFAGTVEAYNRAGGAIGTATMITGTSIDADPFASWHHAMGGRYDGKSGYKDDDSGNVITASGAQNETSYTYQNLILAKSVKAATANAYAFCGAADGYEGLADTGGTVNVSPGYKATKTFFWALMEVCPNNKASGTKLYAMSPTVSSTGKNIYDKNGKKIELGNSELKQSGGTATRYARWRGDETNNGSSYRGTNGANVRLVEGDDFADNDMWTALGWHTTSTGAKDPRGTRYFMFAITGGTYSSVGGIGTVSVKLSDTDTKALSDASVYGGHYLPWLRVALDANSLDDYSMKQQGTYGALLPWPAGTTNLSNYYDPGVPDSYVLLNPADADRVNVEFSQDYVENEGYFTISYGGQQLGDPIRIERRVYTFRYDYIRNVTVQACYGDGSMLETVNCQASQLARHVMTWGNEYYYIPKEQNGIVHGTGSAVNGSGTGTIAGDFITIYNGHALRRDGDVIDVVSGSRIGSVAGLENGLALLDEVTPLQRYTANGMTVETYNRFSDIIGSNLVVRDTQILKSAGGVEGFIDGAMENIKDSVVLFKKDGADHEIILGRDGIMVNLFGTDLCAPKNFRSSGIVYMTNNLNCTAPFILVEYGIRGSMVGYNYMTGEYLFNLYESNESIIDFTKRYFSGDKSMYEDAYLGYASNKALIDMTGTADRLDKLVIGNSTLTDVTDHSTGENTTTVEDGERAGLDQDRTDGNGKDADGFTAERNQADGGVQDSVLLTGSDPNNEIGAPTDDTSMKETEAVSDVEVSKEQVDGYNTLEGDSEVNGTSMAYEKGEFTENNDAKSDANGMAEGDGVKPGLGEGKETEDSDSRNNGVDVAGNSNVEYESTEGMYKPASGKHDDADDEEELTAEADADTAAESEDSDKAIGSNKGKAPEDRKTGSASKKDSDDLNGKQAVHSTAGTSVTPGVGADSDENRMPANSINNGKSPSSGHSDGAEKEDETVVEKAESKLVVVYNQSTGTFEIVDMRQYMTSEVYHSENAKLQISDLGVYAVDAGLAESQEEKKRADGLLLYIALVLTICAGTAGILTYRKKHKL